MERRLIVTDADLAGRTVVRVLHDRGGFSHSRARGLVAAGLVRRNGEVVPRVDERVEAGDRIEVAHDPSTGYPDRSRGGRSDGYRIVHEDRDFVVVDKEPGVLTVPAPSSQSDSLTERIAETYRRRGFRDRFVRAVHRIDRYTSGLVVLARSPLAHAALRAQFASGKPERVYLAVVEGRMESDRGRLVHRLAEQPASLKVHAVRGGTKGHGASCSFRVLERFAAATLLEVRLETGRRNQIRVQFAAEGHPLVGDHGYGSASDLIGRTALHAARLAFEHPIRGNQITFEADIPADLRRLLEALRRGDQSATRTSTPV